jgi:hypothetical protein
MRGVSGFGLFCEDIRREGGGKETLIGVMTETIQVAKFPASFRRLACYFRIRLDVANSYDLPLSVDLETTDGEIKNENMDPAPAEMIERTLVRARKRGAPYGTIFARVRISEPVDFSGPAKIYAYIRYGEEKLLCGFLSVIERPSDPSNASSPPSEQSPPAVPEL